MSEDIKSTDAEYVILPKNELPEVGVQCLFDFYIHLPQSKRFIKYIRKGDPWEERKVEMLHQHTDPSLYRLVNESVDSSVIEPQTLSSDQESTIVPALIKAPEEIKIFKAEIDIDLKEIFVFLSDPTQKDAPKTLKAMEKLIDKVLQAVAPDVEDLRGTILQNSKYLMVMNDASAITSIAVLIAMSHGFNSKKIFRDLSTAILLMDTGLADLPKDLVLRYYMDRPSLSRDEMELIRAHPQKAYDAASKKLRNLPEPVLQLMLNHHENYNSTGYPRAIRNEQLPPVIRSLCLAVNVFEIMKRENLKGNEIDILQALGELKELDVEAHKRTHNQRLVSESFVYISAS